MNKTTVEGTKLLIHSTKQKVKNAGNKKPKELKFSRPRNAYPTHRRTTDRKKIQEKSPADYKSLYQKEVSSHMTTRKALLRLREINSDLTEQSNKNKTDYLISIQELNEKHELKVESIIKEKDVIIRDLQYDFYSSQIKVKSLKLQIKNIFTERSKFLL